MEQEFKTLNYTDDGLGRSKKRENGTYDAFDLVIAEEGARIEVVTSRGIFNFIKSEREENGSVLEDWKLLAKEVGGRAVRFVILEPSSSGGASFLHRGVVLRQGHELGVVAGQGSSIESLGVVDSIDYTQQLASKDDIIKAS